MITTVQQQWLTDYLGVFARWSRLFWGDYKQNPQEIIYQSGELDWMKIIFDLKIPLNSIDKLGFWDFDQDTLIVLVREDIRGNLSNNKKLIMPKGTRVFNIRVQFPPIPEGETEESMNKLLQNKKIVNLMEHDLNKCMRQHYELKLISLSTESARVRWKM